MAAKPFDRNIAKGDIVRITRDVAGYHRWRRERIDSSGRATVVAHCEPFGWGSLAWCRKQAYDSNGPIPRYVEDIDDVDTPDTEWYRHASTR